VRFLPQSSQSFFSWFVLGKGKVRKAVRDDLCQSFEL